MARPSTAWGFSQFRVKRKNLTFGHVMMGAISILAGFVILYPLFLVVHGSFQISDDWGESIGYSFENYHRLLEPKLLTALKNTLVISFGTCALAGVLGVTLSWISARTNSFGLRVLEPFNLVPFYLSPLLGAIAWTYLASPSVGFINQWLVALLGPGVLTLNIYSIPGMIWVMSLFYTPYIYLFTIGSFKKMDPSLEEAARTAGAGLFSTTIRVTVPLMMPGILFALSLTFVTSMGLFSVPATLGMPVNIDVFATLIYIAIEGSDTPNYNLASALGMVILAVTFLTFLIQRFYLLPREFTTVTGKGFRPSIIDLGKWRYATFAFHLLYILSAVVLPIVMLFLVSISKLWQGSIDLSNLTLSHYSWVLFDYPITQRAILNSLFLSAFGATVGMTFCFILAYTIHRLTGKPKAILDFISSLPIGMPAIVLSMGILIAYIRTPLYATIWIILLAYITRFIPVGVKNVISVLLSISRDIEDSSQICGASWLTTVRRILVPLLKSGLISGWMLFFLIFMRELNASILLFSEGNEVMSVVLFLLLEDAPAPQIAAYSMIQVGMMLVLMYFVRNVANPNEVGS